MFKVPTKLEFLSFLNSGLGGFSQVGKFLTIYPQSKAEALLLARKLHELTTGMSAPVIPYDRRYRCRSVVYYRHGSFLNPAATLPGHNKMRDLASSSRDRRGRARAVPTGLHDPFTTGRDRSRRIRGPIGRDYLPYKALMQRGKGGVYEAIDLSVMPARVVIIKEGRRHGETGLRGDDGRDRVHREAAVLRSLRAAGIPVPQVLREFTQTGNRYVVLEMIGGRRLIGRDRTHPMAVGWRSAQRVLERLEPVMRRMHDAGWVWRDCKPSHIFNEKGGVRLIDFEGACRINDDARFPWGTHSYTPPGYRQRFVLRRPGTLEDNYALGVIAFQFLAGRFPPESESARARVYRRTRCPASLRERIERLLGS
ncbi:MAG TPA: lipopolysaccharide kinase InaA family protein [Chthoniobacterales bacterium]